MANLIKYDRWHEQPYNPTEIYVIPLLASNAPKVRRAFSRMIDLTWNE